MSKNFIITAMAHDAECGENERWLSSGPDEEKTGRGLCSECVPVAVVAALWACVLALLA